MPITTLFAVGVVAATGVYFVVLAAFAFFAPGRSVRFFQGFARSAATHYLELAVRLLVGGAFVVAAPRVWFSLGFQVFGWVLLGTTLGLLLVPWRRHRAFAERSVARAMGYLPHIGVVSLVAGLFLLAAVVGGRW